MKKLFKDPLLLFSISFYMILTFTRYIYKGIFLDGSSFSSMSMNLALGKGSFWRLYYTETVSWFPDHPSLAMWLQSWAFRVFGYSTDVEDFWSVGLGFIIIFLMIALWRDVNKKENKGTEWWPIFLFVLMPLVPWALTNNMLENTMTVFVLAASILMLKALRSKKVSGIVMFSSLAAGMLWCALFSKGFQGLFPLALPFFAWLTLKDIRIKNAFSSTIMVFLVLLCLLGITYTLGGDGFKNFVSTYMSVQISSSLYGHREAVAHRSYLFNRFLGEIIVPLMIAFLFAMIYKIREHKNILANNDEKKRALFFLLIALSGSLPLFFLIKQKGWYLLTSLPFYAMAVAQFFTAPTFKKIKFLNTLSIILIIISVLSITVFKNKIIKRDAEFYHDIALQNIDMPKGEFLSVCPSGLVQDWALVPLFQRNYQISLMPDTKRSYRLVEATNAACADFIKDCTMLNKEPKKYGLYKCN